MNYKNSKHIKNRRIGEADLELVYGAFSRLCDDDKKGRVCVTVKGGDFGEICSEDHSALDEMKLRRKPISAVEFLYRSDDYNSRAYISLSDEFTSSSPYNCGISMAIDSVDGQWFYATWKRVEEIIDAIPTTSRLSQFLNKWYGAISFLLSLVLSLCSIRLILWAVRSFGYVIPSSFLLLIIALGWGFTAMWYHGVVSNFICNNYPVVDLDLYKTRTEVRRKCSRFFWWFVGVIGSLTIATYWPFGRQNSASGEMTQQSVKQSETNCMETSRIKHKMDSGDCAWQNGGAHKCL